MSPSPVAAGASRHAVRRVFWRGGRASASRSAGAEGGERVRCLGLGHGLQGEAHVDEDPVAGSWPLLEQGQVDRAGHAAHFDDGQVGVTRVAVH